MAITYDVPLYENTDDNTHCMQASYRMILKYFLPERDFTWEELDALTAKPKDLWTWPMAGLCWLADQGFEAVYIEDFDYEAFKAHGLDYLAKKYGAEMATEFVAHADITEGQEWVGRFMQKVDVDNRKPYINDIFQYLDQGFLVTVSVNSRSLHNLEGYVGHAVVVVGYDDAKIYLNEPGQPGIKNWGISHDQFINGWSYADDGANNITAIRLKQ